MQAATCGWVKTCDVAGGLAQVDGVEGGALPEVVQLLGEAVGDAQPLQVLGGPVLQAAEQRRKAPPRLQRFRVQIACINH